MRHHVWAILWKQIKDTFKNKAILIQFLMFPAMTVIMENAIKIEGMPPHFFGNLFAVMYIGMAPITSMAAIISEEKEKNTLRVLQMSNVKAGEYLLGNALYILTICTLGSLVISLASGYTGKEVAYFMVISLVGHFISMLVGAAVGVASKNQMAATSLTVPAMLVFSFLPMLAMFNESIGKVAKFFFSQQLYLLLGNLSDLQITTETVAVLGGNLVLVIAAFVVAYKKSFGK